MKFTKVGFLSHLIFIGIKSLLASPQNPQKKRSSGLSKEVTSYTSPFQERPSENVVLLQGLGLQWELGRSFLKVDTTQLVGGRRLRSISS